MSAYQLLAIPSREIDANGSPVAGAKLFAYVAGTLGSGNTPLALYADQAGITPLSNPVLADSGGMYPQLWAQKATYDLQATRPDGITVLWQRLSIAPDQLAIDAQAVALAAANGASLVGTQNTGTGSIARTVLAKLNDIKSVPDFPGVTEAVASAYATTSPLYFPAGSLSASASIPHLHDLAERIGLGTIVNGAYTWYMRPTNAQTNTIFVAATGGNDLNDGITPTQAVATLARALAIIASYGSALSQGTWVVSVAAGSYSQGLIDFPVCLANRNRILIQGPIVNHPNVPTAVFDGGGAQAYALNFNSRALVQLSNLKFQNYTSYGVVGQDFSDVYTTNVHISGVAGGPGMKMQEGRLRYYGGIIQTCQTGITCIGQTTFTVGDPAQASTVNGTQILNCTQGGILAQEQSSGHADFVTVTNCAVGLDATVHSRFHAQGCPITNNATAGVRCTDASSWLDNGTSASFSGNGVNEVILDAVGEIGRDGNRTLAQRQPVDITFVSHTGTTAATTKKTYASAIAANSFNSSVKTWEVRIYGELSGTAGTKTLTVNLAGSLVGSLVIPAAATGSYVATFRVIGQGASAQSFFASCDASAAVPPTSNSLAIPMMTGSAIAATVVVTLGSAADTLTIRGVEQTNYGGC